MNLHELSPAPGSKRVAVRVGRGLGSGLGKTSGKGQKGQKSRSGGVQCLQKRLLPAKKRKRPLILYPSALRMGADGCELSAVLREGTNYDGYHWFSGLRQHGRSHRPCRLQSC